MNRACNIAAARIETRVAPRRPAPPPNYDANELVGADGKAEIELDGQVYTLRITKQRKLLLTK